MKKTYQEPSLVLTLIEPNITVLGGGSPANLGIGTEPITTDEGGS